LEQKDTKIAKKSKPGNDFRGFQYVFQQRRKPPLEAPPTLILRDLCDLLFSCLFPVGSADQQMREPGWDRLAIRFRQHLSVLGLIDPR
jgi:hypothetical protein